MSEEALIPSYSFHDLTDYSQVSPPQAMTGQVQGAYITLHPAVFEDIADKIERWFAGRDEVEIVDVGVSDKQGFGFILMEWLGYEIDLLFLAILREEELVGDYTVYGRDMEGA